MALSKTDFIAGLQCEKHIYFRAHHLEFSEPIESPATIIILRGEIPAVFINGLGQANPEFEDVVSAYRTSR